MPLACFGANSNLSAHWKHAKGMSLRYGVIVLRNLMDFLPRKYFIIRGFSPWNGERFLSLGQSGQSSKEGGGGIVWLAAWKLVSNDAKRTVAPPNAKHSTLPQGCFFCFCFWFHPRFRQQCRIYPQECSTEPQKCTNLLGWGNKKKEIGGDFLFL